jgi:hypothetical protein
MTSTSSSSAVLNSQIGFSKIGVSSSAKNSSVMSFMRSWYYRGQTQERLRTWKSKSAGAQYHQYFIGMVIVMLIH